VYSKAAARRKTRSRRWTSLPTVGAAVRRAPVIAADTRILGLDPGSLITGYAVVDCIGGKTQYQVSGSIRAQGESFPERLEEIFVGVSKLVGEWQPREIAIERVFMHRNADSALKLGQARGAAMCATFAAKATVFEYAPRAVKQAVVGTGAADKGQVQLMVKQLLRITGALGADAADALAIALCHAHSRRMTHLLSVAK
jgi:crossover junction endodeoxyribonuclease RuvC